MLSPQGLLFSINPPGLSGFRPSTAAQPLSHRSTRIKPQWRCAPKSGGVVFIPERNSQLQSIAIANHKTKCNWLILQDHGSVPSHSKLLHLSNPGCNGPKNTRGKFHPPNHNHGNLSPSPLTFYLSVQATRKLMSASLLPK